MNTFKNAIDNQEARTTNQMKALKSTSSKCVDLFASVGASRGKNIVPLFVAAYVENPELAVRIALWARDVRSGAGERKVFRDILAYLAENDEGIANRVIQKVPELGRWDDLFAVPEGKRNAAFFKIKEGLYGSQYTSQRGLVAKWMPRKGKDAVALRNYLGLSPKSYRKMLVENTKVVETAMCSREWDHIVYDHVPSVAAARYQKAFGKHDPQGYTAYREGLKKGERKINASTLYPYDVIKSVRSGDPAVALAQWEALPNYLGDANVLPFVDVSGSMFCSVGGKSTVQCIDVSVSFGLYLADKMKGKFKDTFLTFTTNGDLFHMKGDLLQKLAQMERSPWGGSTNLHAAFDTVLRVATQGNVPEEEMPDTILILSDMQFNQCIRYDDSAIQMIRRKYEQAGYKLPRIVFWQLNAVNNNQPVKHDERGVALVSGFSPAIMKSILSSKEFSPEAVMLETVMNDRYDF